MQRKSVRREETFAAKIRRPLPLCQDPAAFFLNIMEKNAAPKGRQTPRMRADGPNTPAQTNTSPPHGYPQTDAPSRRTGAPPNRRTHERTNPCLPARTPLTTDRRPNTPTQTNTSPPHGCPQTDAPSRRTGAPPNRRTPPNKRTPPLPNKRTHEHGYIPVFVRSYVRPGLYSGRPCAPTQARISSRSALGVTLHRSTSR